MQKNIPKLLVQRFKKAIESACQVDGELQNKVLQAMLCVPRHLFIDQAIEHRAYDNDALPIGFSQTISQPSVVAIMTAHLYSIMKNQTDGFNSILEIGTGSGYQSAVLSQLWEDVYTIERIEHLHLSAQKKHQKIGIKNIHYFHGDGNQGLDSHAPFQAIIITACCTEVPLHLQSQLAINGTLIAPIEYENTQALAIYQKKQETDGTIKWDEKLICEVKFVPMLGGIQ
jgi:protein-L-isoaspartate(D-aspartate) O-methyltransferase